MSIQHLTTLLTSLSDTVSELIQFVAYIIAICSLLDSFLPRPLTKDDTPQTTLEKIRKTFVYRGLKKVLSLGGANVKWAANASSPRGLQLVRDMCLAMVNKSSLSDLTQQASNIADDKKATTTNDTHRSK